MPCTCTVKASKVGGYRLIEAEEATWKFCCQSFGLLCRAADMEAGRDKYVSELTEQAVQEQRRQRGAEGGEGGGLFGMDDLTEEQKAMMEKPGGEGLSLGY